MMEHQFSLCYVATLAGHGSDASISDVAVDAQLLYTSSLTRCIEKQPDLGVFVCGGTKAVAVHGNRVFTSHPHDHRIRIWTKKKRRPAASNHTTYSLLATLPTLTDRLVKSLCQHNYLQVRRHHRRLWIQHFDTISALAIAKSQPLMYSASWDKTFKVWSLSTLKCLESVDAHDDALNALLVASHGHVYTASADTLIKVWWKPSHKKKHSLLSTLVGHKACVNAMVLSADEERLYSGGSDGEIFVWRIDGHGGAEIGEVLKGHTRAVLCLCFCSKSYLLFSGSADSTVKVWRRDNKSHVVLGVLAGHTAPVKSLSQSFLPCQQSSSSSSLSFSSFPSSSSLLSSFSSSFASSSSSWTSSYSSSSIDNISHEDIVYSRNTFLICSASLDNTIRVWQSSYGNKDTGSAYQ